LSPASHVRAAWAALPLIAFRGVAGGMPIILGLLIAQRWGLEQLAPFTVANAAIAVAMIVADWGATRALPRNLASLPAAGAAEMLASANAFRLLLVGAMFVAGAIAFAARIVAADVAVYGAILSPLCLFYAITTNGVSERVVAGETRPILTAVLAGLAAFAIAAAIVIATGLGPRWFVAAYVLGKGIESLVITAGRWWVLSVSRGSIGSTAAALWPFSMQMILGVIYTRLSVFTVERMASRIELGVFSVAMALYSALLLVPTSIALVQFPELTRRVQRGDRAGARRLLVRYAIISSGGVAAGVLLLAALSRPIDAMLKVPPAFAGFVIAFAAVSFLSIFSSMAGFLMQAMGMEQLAARLSVVTVLLALAYQLAALAKLGLWGVIVAVAAAEISALLIFGFAMARGREKGWR
jgi:O-antigen/teichoic acid export membrane protein